MTSRIGLSSPAVPSQPKKESLGSSLRDKISKFFSNIFSSRKEPSLNSDEEEMQKVRADRERAAQIIATDTCIAMLHGKDPEGDLDALTVAVKEELLSPEDLDHFEKLINTNLYAAQLLAAGVSQDLLRGEDPEISHINALEKAAKQGLIKKTYTTLQELKERLNNRKTKQEPRGTEEQWKELQAQHKVREERILKELRQPLIVRTLRNDDIFED